MRENLCRKLKKADISLTPLPLFPSGDDVLFVLCHNGVKRLSDNDAALCPTALFSL
ncbi:hypothetical protein EVA_08211 [gut metagenome]|uniref:Uncharacterized protein n=1 Tax=gut metagenome TaxID=749906 RepID=J9CTY6_9ZZZZ